MIRVYHHYTELEEFISGMWRVERGVRRAANAKASADLMRDSLAFEGAMRRVLSEWPKSCAHNLSAEGVNKLAWLGHAGNCISHGSPEENTRIGWHLLSKPEQDEANRIAQLVLDSWAPIQGPQMDMFGYAEESCRD